ncbi:hypothetical protein WMF20_31225 [Sorangium sp. So ce834]|uniref:hypothetical protein n=1 Tax=Sorangium sp. So ce834 TaxID=3133321 RepID=UPI003F638E2D
MGMTLLRMRFVAFAILALGSACGGNVVVDGMPGEGSGGAGAASASANGVGVTSSGASRTSNVAVTSTGGGGGDARSRCLDYCGLFLSACGAVPGSCGDLCDDQLSTAPACNDWLVPFFDCAMGEVFDCNVTPPKCQPLLAQYDACASRDG